MNLAIIIVNFNTARLLKKTLSILIKSKALERKSIIVVDNGEFYKGKRVSLKKILGGLPLVKIKVLVNSENKGFGFACNQGARKTNKKNLLFLNPDCLIQEKDIRQLVEALNSSAKIGIVAPRLFNENQKEQRWSFAAKSNFPFKIFKGKKGKNDRQISTSGNEAVEWVTGACLMVKRKVFLKVNGFDPNFFLYFEDRDFCKRVKKVGYEIVRCLKAKAVHFESQSHISWSKRKKYYYKSQSYFFKKHYGFLIACLIMIFRSPYYIKNVYFSK